MATFRNAQIDEILNYDRNMNRLVLDRQIAQVSRFNDERNPPSLRDIKFEALIGTMIDKLKETIAGTLQSISNQQYSTMNQKNVGRIMNIEPGKEGTSTTAYATPEDTAKIAADFGKQGEPKQDRNQVVLSTTANPSLGAQQVLTLGKDELVHHPPAGIEPGTSTATPMSADAIANFGRELRPLPAGRQPGTSTATPMSAEAIAKFGRGNSSKRYRGGAGETPEAAPAPAPAPVAAPPAPAAPAPLAPGAPATMAQQADHKSRQDALKTLEASLYKIVTDYNGIVQSIQAQTQPEGKYTTKNSQAASHIGYLATVLQQLVEPLKHLLFEITQVHKHELQSMINLFHSLIEIINQSPPFQQVNIAAYKNGIPDFQGVSDDILISEIPQYIDVLVTQRDKLLFMLKKYQDAVPSTMYNVSTEMRDELQRIRYAEGKKTQELLDKIKTELLEVSSRYKKGFKSVNIDDNLLQAVKSQSELLSSDILPDIKRGPNMSLIVTDKQIMQRFNDLESITANIDSLKRQLKLSTALAPEEQREGDADKIDKLRGEIETELQNQKKIRKSLIDVGKTPQQIKDALKKLEYKRHEIVEANVRQLEKAKKLKKSIGRYEYREPLDYEGDSSEHDSVGYDDPRTSLAPTVIGTASGKPSSKTIQQYNRMGRPVSDDQKINKQMVKANKQWQSTSNPVHTTPVGSLVPFYIKPEVSKYDFPTRLRKDQSINRPRHDARGADISLLQGPMGTPIQEPAIKYKAPRRKKVSPEELTQAFFKASEGDDVRTLQGGCDDCGVSRNIGKGIPKVKDEPSGALKKLIFNDENNDHFDEEPEIQEHGFIEQTKEEKDNEPEDRFRNKKLGPAKTKSSRKEKK